MHDHDRSFPNVIEEVNDYAMSLTVANLCRLFLDGTAALFSDIFYLYGETLFSAHDVFFSQRTIHPNSEETLKIYLQTEFGDCVKFHKLTDVDTLIYWAGHNLLDVVGNAYLKLKMPLYIKGGWAVPTDSENEHTADDGDTDIENEKIFKKCILILRSKIKCMMQQVMQIGLLGW
jgi:hypothetical protein